MTTSYSGTIPAPWTAATLDTFFAAKVAEADTAWSAYIDRYVPANIQALLDEYLATVTSLTVTDGEISAVNGPS